MPRPSLAKFPLTLQPQAPTPPHDHPRIVKPYNSYNALALHQLCDRGELSYVIHDAIDYDIMLHVMMSYDWWMYWHGPCCTLGRLFHLEYFSQLWLWHQPTCDVIDYEFICLNIDYEIIYLSIDYNIIYLSDRSGVRSGARIFSVRWTIVRSRGTFTLLDGLFAPNVHGQHFVARQTAL
jgi:hypothetical protein